MTMISNSPAESDPRVREAAVTIPVYGQLPLVPERASGYVDLVSERVNAPYEDKSSVIGAGSIVTRSIPDDVIAWGSPARVIRERNT